MAPTAAGVAGAEALDDDDDNYDDEGTGGKSLRDIESYARTLTAQELAGAVTCAGAEQDAAVTRSRRLRLYSRTAFGLASAAERASLAAVNELATD